MIVDKGMFIFMFQKIECRDGCVVVLERGCVFFLLFVGFVIDVMQYFSWFQSLFEYDLNVLYMLCCSKMEYIWLLDYCVGEELFCIINLYLDIDSFLELILVCLFF